MAGVTDIPAWASQWLVRSGGALTAREREFFVEFERQVPGGPLWNERLGRIFERIRLDGPEDDPLLVVVFRDERQRPGVTYAYEWHLRKTLDDPPHLIVNLIDDDMRRGQPAWDPSPDGIVHVDLQSDRYWQWVQEQARPARSSGTSA